MPIRSLGVARGPAVAALVLTAIACGQLSSEPRGIGGTF